MRHFSKRPTSMAGSFWALGFRGSDGRSGSPADTRLYGVVVAAGRLLIRLVIVAAAVLVVIAVILYFVSIKTVSVLPGVLAAVAVLVVFGGIFGWLAVYCDRRAQDFLMTSLTPTEAKSTAPGSATGGALTGIELKEMLDHFMEDLKERYAHLPNAGGAAQGEGVQRWIDYLEKRLDTWSFQVTAVTASAGLVPATTVSTVLQSSVAVQYLWCEVLGVGAFVIVMGVVVARVIIRRVIIRHLLELILSDVLTSPQQIAHYYARWMTWE